MGRHRRFPSPVDSFTGSLLVVLPQSSLTLRINLTVAEVARCHLADESSQHIINEPRVGGERLRFTCITVTGACTTSLSLNESWPDVVDANEHLDFFLKMDKALGEFLGEFAVRSAPSYSIIASKGEVNRNFRTDVSNALDSLGGSPRAFIASYIEPYDSWYTGRAVEFKTEQSSGQIVSCSLSAQGQNENDVRGQFEMIRNLFTAEINRQFPPVRILEPKTPATSASGHALNGFRRRFDGITRHPVWSGVIAALIVTSILALWNTFSH